MSHSESNIVPLTTDQEESPNKLSFTLEEMLKEFDNGAVPRSKYWRELITALYDTANHVVTGVRSVAKVKPDNKGNIPLLPKHIDAPPMVRMKGADERERQSTQDVFGRQIFYGDACKVVHDHGYYYKVLAGTAYVAGIKFSYPGKKDILIDKKDWPTSVWLDVSMQGDDVSDIQPVIEIVVSKNIQTDYVDLAGTMHYLERIALIELDSTILDHRSSQAEPIVTPARNEAQIATLTEIEKKDFSGYTHIKTSGSKFKNDGGAANLYRKNASEINLLGDRTDKAGNRFGLVIQGVVKVAWLDAVPDATENNQNPTDNTQAIQNAIDLAANYNGAEVTLNGAPYFVAGTIDIKGIPIIGKYLGYRNQSGTRLVGNGSNTILQQKTQKLDDLRIKIKNIRFEKSETAIDVPYMTFAKLDGIDVMQPSGVGIKMGNFSKVGSLFVIMNHVCVNDGKDTALVLRGSSFVNANQFNTCFFQSNFDNVDENTGATIHIDCDGGIGAVSNMFINTEITGNSYGIEVLRTKNTLFDNCYIESKGPSLKIGDRGARAITMRNCTFGSVLTDSGNGTGKHCYIYHTGKFVCSITVDGGYVYSPELPNRDGLKFIFSEKPDYLVYSMPVRPFFEGRPKGWEFGWEISRFQNPVTATDLHVTSPVTPSVKAGYPDDSNSIELYINGTQGGDDFGGVLKSDRNGRIAFPNKKKDSIFLGRVGLEAQDHKAAIKGNTTKAIPVLNQNGSFMGYIPVYHSKW